MGSSENPGRLKPERPNEFIKTGCEREKRRGVEVGAQRMATPEGKEGGGGGRGEERRNGGIKMVAI